MQFRLAAPDEADAFCALSNSLYTRKVAPAYFAWQFFACPHSPFVMTVWENDALIAAFGVHVILAPPAPRAMSLDIMIAAHAQGRGLVKELAAAAMAEARARGAELLCVVANARAERAMAKHLGWRTWRAVPDWTCANDEAESAATVSLAEGPPEDLAGVAGATFYPRERDTLAWRTATPRYAHRWVRVARDGERIGDAVVKTFHDPQSGEGFGDILDVFASEAALGETLSALKSWFAFQGVRQSAFCPAGAAQADAARRAGFAPSPRQRFFCGEGEAHEGLTIGMLDIDVY